MASGAAPSSRQKAKAYLDGRRADPDRLRREIRQLQDQVIDAADQHAAESEAWRQALEAEQSGWPRFAGRSMRRP